MADIVEFPSNEWSKEKEAEQFWNEQNEKIQNSFSEALDNVLHRNVQPYINKHKHLWTAQGAHLQQLRMAKGLKSSDIAKGLGVSPGRIKRLEAGEPVNDAVLLKKAYLLFLTHPSTKATPEVNQ